MIFTKKEDKRFYGGVRYTAQDGSTWNWVQIKRSLIANGVAVLVKTV